MLLLLITEGAVPRLIFDKTVVIKQLNVIEAHGLLLFRADKSKTSQENKSPLSLIESLKSQIK